MKPSILRKLLLTYLMLGLLMGLIFPVYAQFFVEWKNGMLPWFIVGSVIAGLMVGALSYLVCKKVLLERLKKISEVAQAISNNDISQKCKIESHDLIGNIINSFNSMTENLQQMIQQISLAASELDEAANQMATVITESRSNATFQLEETKLVSTSIDEISGTIFQVSEMAEQAAKSSDLANQNAKKSALIATEAMGAISALTLIMNNAEKVVARLDEKSSSISVVIDVIRGIAEQTNLLALNAAIEAARAGDQGRGFAVVADEVRTLATRTQESTEEIEKMIGQMQQGSNEAVNMMKKALDQALVTEEHFESAAELLAEIVGTVSSLMDVHNQFSSAASSQNELIESIRKNMHEINECCYKTSDGATRAVESSQGLIGQAKGLSSIVSRFTL